MGIVRSLAVLLALQPVTLAAAADPAGAAEPSTGRIHVEGCTIDKGPDDLVTQDAPLIVAENARAEDVVAIRGDVTVKRGAVVKQVLAVAGSVRIEPGATVRKGVVAVGGSVRVAAGAHVGEDVLALGGQLDVREGAVVGGSRLALDLSIAGVDVRQKVLEGLHVKGCVIEPKGGAVER